MKKTGMLMKRMMCVVLVMAMLMGVLPSTTVAAADNETKTTVTLKVTTTGTLQEDKVLTKRMLKDCIEVTAIEKTTIRKPGESKKVTVQDEKVITKYDCAQIGKKITYKKDYPNKGCYKLTISYKGAKKSVWVKVRKSPTVKSLKVTLKNGAKLQENVKFTEKLADKSIKVVATLANGKKVVIKAKDYDSKQFGKKVTYKKSGSNKGKYQVEISYKGKKQKIWVPVKKAPTVKSLTVKATQKLPEGKNLTKSMLKVTAKMSDGKTKVITDYSCAQLGKKITYGSNGKFSVTVKSGGKSKKVSLSVQKAPETTFKLSAEMTGQGKLLIDGSEVAFYGGKSTITIKKGNHTALAVAADGHQLKVFEIDGQKQNAGSANFNVTKNTTIKLAFEEIPPVIKYNVSLTKTGNGSVKFAGTELTTAGTKVKPGSYDAEVTPAEGYKLSEWKVNGVKQMGPKATILVADNVKIEAVFVEVKHNVSLTVTGNGSVKFAGAELTTAGTKVKPGSYDAEVTPAEGYKLSEWKVNGLKQVGTKATIIVTNDVKIEAVFEKIEPVVIKRKVTLKKTGDGDGKVSILGELTEAGMELEEGLFEAEIYPNDDSVVSWWKINGVEKTGLISNLPETGDVVIEVEFKKIPSAIKHSVSLVKTGEGTVEFAGKELTTAIETVPGNYQTVVTPAEGYKLTSWSVNGIKQEGTTAEVTVDKDTVIEVVFEEIKHSVSLVKTGEGTVEFAGKELTTAIETVPGNYQTVVTPAEGYSLTSWSINGVKQRETTAEVIVTEDTVIEVVFTAIPKHKVSVAKTGMGKVFIDSEEVEFYKGNATLKLQPGLYEVDNQAADGYKFSTFKMDGRALPSAKETISVTKETTLEVVFVEEDVYVTVSYNRPEGGNILKEAVLAGDALNPPEAPSIKDKEFEGWLIDGILYPLDKLSEMLEVIKSLTKNKQDVEITASYRNVEVYYTVTTNVLLADEYGNELPSNSVLAGTKIQTIAPEEKDGQVFSHYENEKGENIGNSRVYQTFIHNNRTILAVYEDKPAPKEPLVYFKSEVETNPAEGKLLYQVSIDIPVEYEVLEWGVALSTSNENVDCDTGKRFADTSDAQHANLAEGPISVTNTKAFERHAVVHAIPYAIIKSADGGTQVVYGSRMHTQL